MVPPGLASPLGSLPQSWRNVSSLTFAWVSLPFCSLLCLCLVHLEFASVIVLTTTFFSPFICLCFVYAVILQEVPWLDLSAVVFDGIVFDLSPSIILFLESLFIHFVLHILAYSVVGCDS